MADFSAADLARARDDFAARGESVAQWARARGFSEALTYSLLAGRLRARRGQAHHIAVALGLKSSATSLASALPSDASNQEADMPP